MNMKTRERRFTWKIGESNGPWLNVCIMELGETINKIWIYNTLTHQEKVGWTTNLNSFLNKAFDKEKNLEKDEKHTKAKLALELLNPDENGISNWYGKSDFVDKFKILDFNNGNPWYRDPLIQPFNYEKTGSGKTYRFRVNGFKKDYDNSLTRLIRPDIREIITTKNCVHTGFRNSPQNHIVVDHKNGRYNDKNVLTPETQKISDFQALCNQANLQKRSDCAKCLSTGGRFDAKELGFSISYYLGDEIFDETSSNGCEGCYWYDPIKFKSNCH